MIKFLDLEAINASYKTELHEAARRVIDSGWYLLGSEVEAFEDEFAQFVGTSQAIGVGNGLDALRVILRAYKELGAMEDGDEVIVPANTYIASILAITDNDLTPVLVEPDPASYNIDPSRIEAKITDRTRAVMIVHLYGQNAYTNQISELCETHDLKLIEDAAQSHGAYFQEARTGALGDAAGFSFYPGKNLGALGDAGAITTDDDELAETCRTLANYGSEVKYENKYQGYNTRLDEMQAAFLRVRLQHLPEENQRRREIAQQYLSGIEHPDVILPAVYDFSTPDNSPVTVDPSSTPVTDVDSHVWHLFVSRHAERDEFRVYLDEQGVQTLIHYPIPPHHQEAYADWKEKDLPITEQIHEEVFSLPMGPHLTDAEVDEVIKAVNSYPAGE